MDPEQCKSGVFQLAKRAEAADADQLTQTFVNFGHTLELLSNRDHQVVFGRRGTGKTHILSYLANMREKVGDVVAFVDLRQIGSSVGMYNDDTLPVSDRATRLLIDAFQAIHDCFFDRFVGLAEQLDLSQTGPALDILAEAVTRIRVSGTQVTRETTEQTGESRSTTALGLSITAKEAGLSIGSKGEKATKGHTLAEKTEQGVEQSYLNFGEVVAGFQSIANVVGKRRIWILLDEWGSIPLSLQPFLADMIRRALLPVSHTTVKIAAIEQRSKFQFRRENGDYVGIELGADMSADINLDDFMVFDNDAEKAKAFFGRLIESHLRAVLPNAPPGDGALLNILFTESRAIDEFIRACEGVPRDAMNILSMAAQVSTDSPISVSDVRKAAQKWYVRDKERAATVRDGIQDLLHWIIAEVIGKRRARAFLLESHASDELIESLYDARVLHVRKRGVSTNDKPGVRYTVYKLDYGCYVDLVTTVKAPLGLLALDDGDYVDVPPDDYRSIRRAILDLGSFYSRRI